MKSVDKGTRIGNWMVDTIVLVVVTTIITYIIAFYYPQILEEDNNALGLLISAIVFFYYFIFESVSGKTIGKILSHTIVVDKNGEPPKKVKLLVRSFIRLTPIYGLSLLFGHQGIHDMLSSTTVVKVEKANASTIKNNP
ncbi:RDD family protein [Flavihumibacter fluvii]|uniref:RDD family protein n=1 Tax=Flavihumibacter fluvii TaxID=2838157 RepID=UPI001BDEA7E7|nr:RDD family protein [Flavihumibacter fluvii]ULQ51768.1 RDD family protein [Flavihumibacter fluvii]